MRARYWTVLAAGLALSAWSARRIRRYEVAGESMVPALFPGDFVLVDRAAYRKRLPRPGEIVVLRDPRQSERELVKRVVRVDLHGQVWAEGDNLADSTDSRTFGPVPASLVEGKVLFRYWPLMRRASSARTSASVGNASWGGVAGST